MILKQDCPCIININHNWKAMVTPFTMAFQSPESMSPRGIVAVILSKTQRSLFSTSASAVNLGAGKGRGGD